MRSIFSTALVLALLGTTPAFSAEVQPEPAHRAVTTYNSENMNDPIEPFNRAVFQFNRFVDFLVIKPVTTVYTTIFPQFMRNGVTSFLANLGAPVVMLNTALQGDWTGFETTLHRFVINTTLGMGGVNDVASDLNIRPVQADFGQTLGKWGMGQGFYLVLPIIGPSSGRDAVGRLFDTVVDPYNLAFTMSDTEWPIWARAGMTVVDARARYGADYDNVMKTAVDPYVTFRSIYTQRRNYVVMDKTVTSYDSYSAADVQ